MEAKKPIYIAEIKGLLGHYECPNCHSRLSFWKGDNEPSVVFDRCSECNEKIDWSERCEKENIHIKSK